MHGVIFLGERKLRLEQFPDPAPGPRDVIVEIKASGMCGAEIDSSRIRACFIMAQAATL